MSDCEYYAFAVKNNNLAVFKVSVLLDTFKF